MRKIKKISLVFENCEYIDLDMTMIRHLRLSGVAENYEIIRDVCDKSRESGFALESKSCTYFSIEINSKGYNKKIKPYPSTTLRKRLKSWDDITQVVLVFKDGKEETIYVPWKGEAENNFNQRVHFFKDTVLVEIDSQFVTGKIN